MGNVIFPSIPCLETHFFTRRDDLQLLGSTLQQHWHQCGVWYLSLLQEAPQRQGTEPFSAIVIKTQRQLGVATASQEQRESGRRETAGNSLLIVHAETVFISVSNWYLGETASLEKTAHPPQTPPVRAQARCPALPVLMEWLAGPQGSSAVPVPPHPTSSSRRFGELNRRESCGAAGRMGAELSLWQRGHFGEFCTERCLFIGKESCVSLQSPLRGRDCPHPYGSCQHHPSSCQKEHWALNFPLGISPPPFSFLRPPPKTAAIAHTRSSKAALNYLKAQQVF